MSPFVKYLICFSLYFPPFIILSQLIADTRTQIGEYVLFPTRCWGTFGSLFIFFVTYFSNNEFSKKKKLWSVWHENNYYYFKVLVFFGKAEIIYHHLSVWGFIFACIFVETNNIFFPWLRIWIVGISMLEINNEYTLTLDSGQIFGQPGRGRPTKVLGFYKLKLWMVL